MRETYYADLKRPLDADEYDPAFVPVTRAAFRNENTGSDRRMTG